MSVERATPSEPDDDRERRQYCPDAGPAPVGLELVCEGADIKFRIADATLILSAIEQRRAAKRWNEVKATYTLEAKGQTLTGTVVGQRYQDFGFMSLQGSVPDPSVLKVELIVSRPDGQMAQIEWPAKPTDKEQAGGKVTCGGSLMSAMPSEG